MAADVDSGHDEGKDGKVRSKKASNHIDMTPMVDLGFLLLTFFMLASSFNRPQVMEVQMPDKPKNEEKTPLVQDTKVLNLALGADDKIYYYSGVAAPEINVTDYSKEGLRKLLQDKKKEIDGLVVLIKPMEKSRYKNIVDMFDEMNITDVKTYAMVDISPNEVQLIQKYKETH